MSSIGKDYRSALNLLLVEWKMADIARRKPEWSLLNLQDFFRLMGRLLERFEKVMPESTRAETEQIRLRIHKARDECDLQAVKNNFPDLSKFIKSRMT